MLSTYTRQEALLSQRGRACFVSVSSYVVIASIVQYVKCNLTIIRYTLALDLPLRKLNYVLLFGVVTGAWLSVP